MVRKTTNSPVRIPVDGEALERLNILSKQFRTSRAQLVTLLVETVSDEYVAEALLQKNDA